MATVTNETSVDGRKYRQKTSDGWKWYSFIHKAKDVLFNDGDDETDNVENNLGAIKGLTTSFNVTETGYAVDATALHEFTSMCGGSVIRGTTDEEALYSKTVYVQKDGETIAFTTINDDGTFSVGGITEIGEVTITATDASGNVAKNSVVIHSYSLYEVKLNFSVVYAFHVDGGQSTPSSMITYLEDAVGMTPAYMNYASDTFDYGSWENAFFMPKPCMLKYNGTVDYYLDPNNYALKKDGTSSDIINTAYGGNAMMEWGQNGKRIYYKIVPDTTDATSATVYISDAKMDDDYMDWSFINNQGVEVDHFYTPIYNGANVSSVLRSMSGLTPIYSQTATTEITYAKANNQSDYTLWYTEVYSDCLLINLLLMLIGKSMDTQTVFGNGHYTGGSSASNLLKTGTMDAKGLFYGTNGTGKGVKVFGMENWWGNQWRRYAGHINASGQQKVKFTYGTQDGSTTNGYNTDGTGYISIGVTPSGTSGGYISKMYFNDKGMWPQVSSGSATTYYCDGLWFNNSQTNYALRGGRSDVGLLCGAFACSLSGAASGAAWDYGAGPSCKPLAQ